MKFKPYAEANPLISGKSSLVKAVYFWSKPSIFNCLVPVTALEKETSTVALVSKLSERLQHAAFNNSFELILKTKPASFLLSAVAS